MTYNKLQLIIKTIAICIIISISACKKDSTNDISTNNQEGYKTTYILKPLEGPIKNPHKGFTLLTEGRWNFSPEFRFGPYGKFNNKAWDLISYGSGYQQWDKINPEKGVYDFSELDDLLDALWEHEMGYALRVLPYSPSFISSNSTPTQEYDWTPKWVYDMGAKKIKAKLEGTSYYAQVPVWDDEKYIWAAKELAKALAEKYDGDPRIEYIDIRSFGEWGEWHTSHLEGSEMPSLEIQKDILDYYTTVFKKTQLVLPSDGYGEIYSYALKKGITKRDDGFIGIPGTADSLVRAYNANLPTIAENLGGYATMLEYDDIIPGGYLKWTAQRWVDAIKTAHLTYYVLDQESDCGYQFYNENKALADSMTHIIGYNFRITQAELISNLDANKSSSQLNITISNTGIAPCFFDIFLVAELADSLGNSIEQIGQTIKIPKGTFKDSSSQKFSFSSQNSNILELNITLSLYEREDDYKKGQNPTVIFDNYGTMDNKKLLLIKK